jgi:hypothetical protein
LKTGMRANNPYLASHGSHTDDAYTLDLHFALLVSVHQSSRRSRGYTKTSQKRKAVEEIT